MLKVYSDKNALPFFNSDSCDGDNFTMKQKKEWQKPSTFGTCHIKMVGLTPHISEILDCDGIITKVPAYAVERTKAIQRIEFTKSEHLLIGKTGYAYDGYWIIE